MVKTLVLALLLVITMDIQSVDFPVDTFSHSSSMHHKAAVVDNNSENNPLPGKKILTVAHKEHGKEGEFSLDGRIRRPGRRAGQAIPGDDRDSLEDDAIEEELRRK